MKYLPEINDNIPISILIGKDLLDAHDVLEQCTGVRNSPYAQRLLLGWVVVGESCLHKVHPPKNNVIVNKTFVLPNGRTSICEPCPNDIDVQQLDMLNGQS